MGNRDKAMSEISTREIPAFIAEAKRSLSDPDFRILMLICHAFAEISGDITGTAQVMAKCIDNGSFLFMKIPDHSYKISRADLDNFDQDQSEVSRLLAKAMDFFHTYSQARPRSLRNLDDENKKFAAVAIVGDVIYNTKRILDANKRK